MPIHDCGDDDYETAHLHELYRCLNDLQRSLDAERRYSESLRAELKTLKESAHPTESRDYWNYRIIKIRDHDGCGVDCVRYGMHEVHYENDKPVLYSAEPCELMQYLEEEDTEEGVVARMRHDLELMLKALDKPVLTKEDFTHESA